MLLQFYFLYVFSLVFLHQKHSVETHGLREPEDKHRINHVQTRLRLRTKQKHRHTKKHIAACMYMKKESETYKEIVQKLLQMDSFIDIQSMDAMVENKLLHEQAISNGMKELLKREWITVEEYNILMDPKTPSDACSIGYKLISLQKTLAQSLPKIIRHESFENVEKEIGGIYTSSGDLTDATSTIESNDLKIAVNNGRSIMTTQSNDATNKASIPFDLALNAQQFCSSAARNCLIAASDVSGIWSLPSCADSLPICKSWTNILESRCESQPNDPTCATCTKKGEKFVLHLDCQNHLMKADITANVLKPQM